MLTMTKPLTKIKQVELIESFQVLLRAPKMYLKITVCIPYQGYDHPPSATMGDFSMELLSQGY